MARSARDTKQVYTSLDTAARKIDMVIKAKTKVMQQGRNPSQINNHRATNHGDRTTQLEIVDSFT